MTLSTPAERATLLSPASLAKYLDVPVATIYAWNYHGTGPRVLHVGRHVRYRQSDVDAWLVTQEKI
jgi:excisionase family DNA binding protein